LPTAHWEQAAITPVPSAEEEAAGQLRQPSAWPDSAYIPAVQAVQVELPTAEDLPASQARQRVPVPAEYRPTGQFEQVEAWPTDDLPGAQFLHPYEVISVFNEYVPAVQLPQAPVASPEAVASARMPKPAPHAWHPLLAAEPAISTENLPAAQTRQAVPWEYLPEGHLTLQASILVEPVVVVVLPESQSLHMPLLGRSWYLPIGQATQLTTPLEYLPATQVTQLL